MDIQALAHEIPDIDQSMVDEIDFISNGKQFLMFNLASECYAVDILCVEEIRSWELPTKIPNSPEYVKGVINIRGLIVPIIDFRLKFNICRAEYLDSTVVMVLTIENGGTTKTMGFVVDAVSDVIDVEEQDIQADSGFVGSIPQESIQGLVNVGESVVTILNVNALQQLGI
ncbi:purine-binding chemotaxis protein CheW [Thalassotalea insulae]|uniref:Chemotaxis protein CheW n=1 Tax=Thalassotalea insulae TaxID=2056778 RepID=A0ABQ6GLU6_9GAMM|nr:chemotaxis protein CheW [Thalassotalea insulae]GLX76826.1 purine-binding chemotaxis protein CheW [Thalassotalea insulae]